MLVNNLKTKAMLEFILFLILMGYIGASFSIGKDANGINWHFELSLNR